MLFCMGAKLGLSH